MAVRMRLDPRPAISGLTVGLCLLAGCTGGGGAPTAPSEPGIAILSGDGKTDTISAILPEPVRIVVRDAQGRAATGVEVWFGGCGDCGVGLLPQPTSTYAVMAFDTTNAFGEAGMRVRLGGRLGPVTLPISVPTLGYNDTARFTVLIGQPALLELEPADTGLIVGRSFSPRARVTDRAGNPTAETPTLASLSPATLGVSGSQVTGVEYGRGQFQAAWGDTLVTAWVSVVPQGRLAVIAGLTIPRHLLVYDTDGANRLTVGSDGTDSQTAPAWHPSGTSLVWEVTWPSTWIKSGPLTGAPSSLEMVGAPLAVAGQPAWTLDGAWLYFRGSPFPSGGGEVWRVRPDGTGPERIGPAGNSRADVGRLDVAPDGATIAMQFDSSVINAEPPRIRLLSTTTGTVVTLQDIARSPRWSPDGQWLAFLGEEDFGGYSAVFRVRPDGTDLAPVSPPGRTYHGGSGLDWSSDGEWIVASAGSRLELIRVADGLTIPLPNTEYHTQPSWEP